MTLTFFTQFQCGFRRELGVNDAIDKLLSYVYNQINQNNLVLAIFYDLSKAFDTINHEILLCKLEGAGLKDNCLKLMKNYLNNRKQICKANGLTSKLKNIVCGVPQGSTMGPLLFIIYE